ncbi:Hypp550 [Branchiostoma lanceolatum]|uniref:Hypp550 protein n=1 Tax=Branchiostoma lanceolatum TaxID=7740 RepID=A0A8J9YLF2_BRALA|nr:Hypp550 [Branchiostoma lanceolatum]
MDKVEWREGDKEDILIITGTETKDGQSQKTCVLSIHFWKNGTICIQGSAFLGWTDKIFPTLKKKVEETYNTRQNGDTSQTHATGNQNHDTGSSSAAIPEGKTLLSSNTENNSSEITDLSDETPLKAPTGTPMKKNRFRKAVENFISPFRSPTTPHSPLTLSDHVMDTEENRTPSIYAKDPSTDEHITRDIQKHYTDLVDLVNNLQTDLKALKTEQDKQKGEFEKELKTVSRELTKQLDEEKTRHANESKSVNSRHNEEIATLTAQCESLRCLVETQQQQIVKLQEVTDSIQLSQSISKMRTYAETVKTNPGNHANHATIQPNTQEINSDVETTQPVMSQERQQTPTEHERSTEIRVYTDSIWKAVNVSRMFPNRSTHKDQSSTISIATKKLETANDPGTSYAILHVGSNDLDNSRHDDSSVQDCLQKTEELVSHAKTSFPNATVVLSQVLPRGHDPESTLNKNIKSYNQSVMQMYKDDEKILYVRHKKLSVSRQLYKRDGIHLDDITGTSLLVADVKRTIWSLENTHPGHNSETRNQHMRSQQGDDTPSSSQSRPRQDNRPQQYRDRGRSTRSWRSDNYTAGEWRRRPSAPHEDIMNLAYKLKGLLNTI